MASIAETQAALLQGGVLQFDLPAVAAPASPSTWHPSWGFGDVDVVWILAALGAAVAIGLAVVYLRNHLAVPDASAPGRAPEPSSSVAPAGARLVLGDADRLAALGLHLEAARALLACGLDALGERHPGLVQPTTTSRDIAGDATLPEPMRLGFGRIAHAVEVGLFGGQPVAAEDYADCRRAFVASALTARAGPAASSFALSHGEAG